MRSAIKEIRLWDSMARGTYLDGRAATIYPFSPNSPLVLRYPGRVDSLVEKLAHMNNMAYQNIMPQYGVGLWQVNEFTKRLDKYRNVLLYPEANGEFRFFILFSDPIQVDTSKFVKIGPIGFSPEVSRRQKVVALSESLIQLHNVNQDACLWAEVPAEPNPIAKLLLSNGFVPTQDMHLIRNLLEESRVKVSEIKAVDGELQYTSAKCYSQKVFIKQLEPKN